MKRSLISLLLVAVSIGCFAACATTSPTTEYSASRIRSAFEAEGYTVTEYPVQDDTSNTINRNAGNTLIGDTNPNTQTQTPDTQNSQRNRTQTPSTQNPQDNTITLPDTSRGISPRYPSVKPMPHPRYHVPRVPQNQTTDLPNADARNSVDARNNVDDTTNPDANTVRPMPRPMPFRYRNANREDLNNPNYNYRRNINNNANNVNNNVNNVNNNVNNIDSNINRNIDSNQNNAVNNNLNTDSYINNRQNTLPNNYVDQNMNQNMNQANNSVNNNIDVNNPLTKARTSSGNQNIKAHVLVATKGSEVITIFVHDDADMAKSNTTVFEPLARNAGHSVKHIGKLVYYGTDNAVRVLETMH